jgi:2-C-methyl-D-erythritol 4-phosphate cytidylyltransferase
VRILEAPPSNIKLTTPFDLTVAEAVLAGRAVRQAATGTSPAP